MPYFPEDKPRDNTSMVDSSNVQSSTEDSALRARRIRIKNRRKRYLDLHPEYFTSSGIELADPLLYDRLVRRFQSAAEREAEGRSRGYSGMLEADLVRSEAKVEALAHPDPNSPLVYRRDADGSITEIEQDEDERAGSREGGMERWRDVMEQRFLRGEDREFEYETVDESEDYDDRAEEERSVQEEYFDGEEEQWLNGETPKGETGVQDF